MKNICFLLTICFGLVLQANASEEISFRHIQVKDGLSHSQINHIYKDSKGFMWFATASGLNRYDGYSFKVFNYNKADSLSLPESFIDHIQEDADGNLWIHTGRRSYVLYNPEKENFINNMQPVFSKMGIHGSPSCIYIDSLKNICSYVETQGVYQYKRDTGTLIHSPVGGPGGISNEKVCDIAENTEGILLMYDNGLIECISRENGKVIWQENYIAQRLSQKYHKFSMFIDGDGDVWIYSKDSTGMWVYYPGKKQWEFINSSSTSPYRLSSNIIYDVKQDKNGLIWVGTDHGGINIINKNLRTVNYLVHNAFDERSVVQNTINCLYCDDLGIVWVGTHKKGLSYYSESIFKFDIDHLSNYNTIRGFTPDVNTLAEDRNGNLWIGTNSNGVICLDSYRNPQKIFRKNDKPQAISADIIVSMLISRNGNLWIGTYLEGLNCFDGNKFTHYRHQPGNPNSLLNNNVWALAEDEQGILWIGTLGNGLQSLNQQTGEIKSYSPAGSDFAADFISSICISKDGKLYIGTATGLVIFDPKTEQFERLQGNRSGTQSFSHLNINQVYEDSRGLLWIATHTGLNIYDRRKDEIKVPDHTDGLAYKTIHAIVEDNNKNIWITTSTGVTNIIVSFDPQNNIYNYTGYNYNELDGLQSHEFNLRSILKTQKGLILMGGANGLNIFNPEQIKYNRIVPKVTFTGLQLFNEEVKIDSLYDGNRILTESISKTEKVKLKYKQNVFSVSFSSMNYILPEKTTYQYILKGFNQDWLTADGNKITYTNLAPGKYTLEVRAINSDGFAADKTAAMDIVVMPPFWASVWAYCLYILLILGILFFARHQLLKSERSKYKIKQVEQEAAQKHELDDMKLRFFTNISHELRTPLTLIISPLENLIATTEDEQKKQKLQMVHRNAIRLLTMVNQLLDFRKSDVKGHQLNLSQGGDIIQFIRNISASFVEYSEKNNVHLTFFSSVPELTMAFDEDKISKIIMNLLSNAFKFTAGGGRVDVAIDLLPREENTQEMLEIKVSDTGIGIDDKDKELIFERFYQVQQRDHHKLGGSGVGLHLVKEFVQLHGGKVTVCDNVVQGSVFIVTLPVNAVTQPATTTPLPETPDAEEQEDILPAELHNGHPVILIIDDSNDFRLFMKESLKTEFTVKEAVNGTEAWEIIPNLQPDIIISDVMMPGMDGIELCKLIKTDIRTSHIPLILLTARSAEEQKREGLMTGADDYITKPFNFDILLLRIRKLLQLRKSRQEVFRGQIEVSPSEITITSLDEKLIQKAIKYVEDNMSRSELSVEELSRELGMSRVHLYKKLLSITGKTPIEFIRTIRLKRAAQLLKQSQLNVSEIAYQVGFNNPKYFSKYFKEEFGVLPSAYSEKK